MKKILFSLLVVMLSGCVTNATRSVDDFQSQVQVNYDGFKKTTWVETPSYYFIGEDNFSVMVALRSLYVQGKKEGIQIYIEKMGTKWGFIILQLVKMDINSISVRLTSRLTPLGEA